MKYIAATKSMKKKQRKARRDGNMCNHYQLRNKFINYKQEHYSNLLAGWPYEWLK